MNVLIIGSGNGGLAFGAKLIEKGIKVNLYDKFDSVLTPIQENNNTITMTSDGYKKELKFNKVTSDLEDSLVDMAFIFVITPAFAHKSVAVELSKYIAEGQIVVLHPGRTGGALEFKKVFNLNRKENVIVEAETMLFACRKSSPTEIIIHGTKKSVGLAAIPEDMSQEVTDEINNILPYFHSSGNVLSTSLSNIGAIFHPAPFLFNLARVECNEDFKYYHEGITPSIAKLLEALDTERLNIASKFGLNLLSAREWINYNYSVNGDSLYEAIQANISYADIFAPKEVNSRYVMEDIPMSLVPMKELAKLVEVETPTLNSIIEVATKIYDYDFISKGRKLEDMAWDASSILNTLAADKINS